MRLLLATVVVLFIGALPCAALDDVLLRRGDRQIRVSGRVLVTAQDGGILLLSPTGVLWPVEPKNLVSRQSDERPFTPGTAEQVGQAVQAELPKGFELYHTAHYVICHNTSRAYAAWCGALLERLYRAFSNFWVRKGFPMEEPEFPLVSLVFADRESYLAYAKNEVGDAAEAMIGYYSLHTNRIIMYDLTGIQSLRRSGDRRSSAAQINAMLARPEAEQTVATVIHEATHQIAFNRGLQTRLADIPLWVSEGIAMYFETPDLESAKGWRTIGAVNGPRLARFREYQARRPADSLRTLVADDTRIRNSQTALDAYAEAWALNYYLLRQRSKQYVGYLKMLSTKEPLVWDDKQTRIKQLEAALGTPLEKIDADFVRQTNKLR